MKQYLAQGRLAAGLLLFVIIAPLLAACNTPSANLTPVEEEQIKNVVQDYYVRNTSIPDQEVEVQEVVSDRARVAIRPAGVETAPDLIFLQDYDAAAATAPAAETTVQPGNQASITTTTGWTIILGPQAQFTSAELDAAGIPAAIRQ